MAQHQLFQMDFFVFSPDGLSYNVPHGGTVLGDSGTIRISSSGPAREVNYFISAEPYDELKHIVKPQKVGEKYLFLECPGSFRFRTYPMAVESDTVDLIFDGTGEVYTFKFAELQ